MRRHAVSLACALSVAGCAELTVYETPMAQGDITDARSGKSIPSACVTVESRPDATTCTDDQGHFVLKPISHKKRFLAIFPIETFPPRGRITIEAKGYEKEDVELRGRYNDLHIKLQASMRRFTTRHSVALENGAKRREWR